MIMRKSLLFKIHSFAGLFSGIFILLMSASGALLVFHGELDNLQQPAVKPWPLKNITVDNAYQVVQKNYPHAQVNSCTLPENNRRPFSFVIYDSSYRNGEKAMEVFLHPQTGAVLSTRGGSEDCRHNFMSWLSSFHNSFRLHKKGEWLLGFFSVIFLLSIITGIILYRRKAMAVLLFRKSIFKKGNLHQIIGTWALLFNLMIAVTGFWMQRYVFKKAFYSNQTYVPVLKPSPALFFQFDSAYGELKKKFPGFSVSVIYFAQSRKGKTAVYGSKSTNSFIHSRKFADAIFLDSTGNIAKTAFVNDIKPEDRYDIINAQVHYGQYGGLPVRVIYGLFGLTGGLLGITGFVLWLKRRKAGKIPVF